MAGDWIKMRADLFSHPKVVRIASALKADRLRVVGGLMAVWCLFDAHSVDGTLDGYTPEALDDLVGWPGFSAAMCSVGWLEDSGQALVTPRFSEHNGQSAKRRATETERKRLARAVGETSASDADKKRTREEKRREEETGTSVPVTRAARGTRKCPDSWLVSADLKAWAAEEVPGLDIRAETKKFRDHTFKTARTDWPGTWRNWMRQAHENVRTASDGRTAKQIAKAAEIGRMTGGYLGAPAPALQTFDMEPIRGPFITND